jgi:hypothetical protein
MARLQLPIRLVRGVGVAPNVLRNILSLVSRIAGCVAYSVGGIVDGRPGSLGRPPLSTGEQRERKKEYGE